MGDTSPRHTLDGVGAFVGPMVRGGARALWGWHVVGRDDAVPAADRTFLAWAPVFRAALAALFAGVILGVGVRHPAALYGGAVLGGLGAVVLIVAWSLASIVAWTRPSALRLTPVDLALDGFGEPALLTPWDDKMWVASAPLWFHGLPLGARMTVIDTGDGLLLYSPVEATPERVAAVAALGTVAWIVAPNPMHHLFVAGWRAACPGAVVVGPSALATRVPGLSVDLCLDDPALAPWPGDRVDTAIVRGHDLLPEIVLRHRASGTLVVADLVMNCGQEPGRWRPFVRAWLLRFGMDRRPGPPLEYKLTVADPLQARADVDAIARWDLRAILPAHGPPIRRDAAAAWVDAFGFLGA